MCERVSVIIPVRNEGKYIVQCIESVLKQTYPEDRMEVLLVDGMSEDGTREIIRRYSREYEYIKMLENPRKIVPCALNIGIRASSGEIIVRMDAHSYYDETYIAKCVETHNRVAAANVGGRIETLANGDSLIAEAIALATSSPFGVGDSKFRTGRSAEYVDTVAFGAFKREIFDKVGLFDEELIRNQDIEFNSRIISSGEKVYLNPEIKAYYYNQDTLTGLWKQSFGNGMWNVFTLTRNRKALSLRHFVPAAFVATLLLCLLLGIIRGEFFILLAGVLGMYFGASVVATLLSCRRAEGVTWVRKAGLCMALPVVFGVLHVGYGVGYIWGLAKLKRFRKERTLSQR